MTHLKRNDCQLYLNGHLKEMKVSETQLPREGSQKQRPHAVNEMPCSNLAGLWLSESQLRKRGGRWSYQSLGEPAHLQHKGYVCFLCENMTEEGAEGPRRWSSGNSHTLWSFRTEPIAPCILADQTLSLAPACCTKTWGSGEDQREG